MSPQPEWIPEFVEDVCAALRLFDEDAPIGCHYFPADEGHEVTLFISSTEVVGGPNDGERITARFLVDIVELMTVFDVLDSMTWQPHLVDQDDELGPNLSATGSYRGETVWLRILGETPEQFLPGRLAIVAEKKFVNIWEQ